MRSWFVILGIVGNGFLTGAFAQIPAPVAAPTVEMGKVEKIPLNPGPIIARAPDFAKWTVTLVYPEAGKKAAASAPAARLLSVELTKTKNIYFEQETFSDGSKKKYWHFDSMQIEAAPYDSNQMVIYTPGSFGFGGVDATLFTDYSVTDFPNLTWPSPGNYQGVQKVKGREYLVFRDRSVDLFPGLNLGAMDTVARIDVSTHLPIQIQTPAVTLVYQYDPTPPAMIVLPPEAQHALDQRAQVSKMTTPHSSY